eukprot:NODE_368_length_2350_cov_27.200348_g343_i0.p1 GENE.NODE_368_length_2350_cov_27.200348_g343_i0~~NODE_368_length_2350_cov_27.200348_g343_i0.p1  ORF type:complete len:432 (+),score=71.39 NODE_368_length_2350_cov_27.200348_g343_i0:60-1298(+)
MGSARLSGTIDWLFPNASRRKLKDVQKKENPVVVSQSVLDSSECVFINTLINYLASCFPDATSLCVATAAMLLKEQPAWKVAMLAGVGLSSCFRDIPRSTALENLLLIIFGTSELIVDFQFVSRFTVIKKTDEYAAYLKKAPQIFLGSEADLITSVRLASQQLKECYDAQRMSVPPWRGSEFTVSTYCMSLRQLRAQMTANYNGTSGTQQKIRNLTNVLEMVKRRDILKTNLSEAEHAASIPQSHPAYEFFLQLALCDLGRVKVRRTYSGNDPESMRRSSCLQEPVFVLVRTPNVSESASERGSCINLEQRRRTSSSSHFLRSTRATLAQRSGLPFLSSMDSLPLNNTGVDAAISPGDACHEYPHDSPSDDFALMLTKQVFSNVPSSTCVVSSDATESSLSRALRNHFLLYI